MKILVLSDLHCGHVMGLTTPSMQTENFQEKFWDWFATKIDANKPYDICVCNGDAVEGTGRKNSIEHITTDMNKQVKMAIEILKYSKAKQYYMTYGTPYHVLDSMEYEKLIANEIGAKIDAKIKLEVFGKIFDFKHTASKTSVPHGQGLVIKKLLWSIIKSVTENKRKPDYLIRSHVHEYACMDTRMGTAITTPGLQLGDCSYGRKFDGWYDVGFLVFDIQKDSIDFTKYLYECKRANDIIKI